MPSDQPATAAQEFREGDCIVMSQYQGPGAIWFRISRGWINGYGLEVPADWPANPGAVLIARDGKPVSPPWPGGTARSHVAEVRSTVDGVSVTST